MPVAVVMRELDLMREASVSLVRIGRRHRRFERRLCGVQFVNPRPISAEGPVRLPAGAAEDGYAESGHRSARRGITDGTVDSCRPAAVGLVCLL